MANIDTYINDTVITGGDRLLGTDANGGVTRNYTIDDISAFSRTDVINQNAADADEPLTFKLWSGTLSEYESLTPQNDTLYNVLNDINVVSFDSLTNTPTTLLGYGITDGGLPSFVTPEDSSLVGSYTFSSAETFGATTMSLTTTVGLQIGDQFVNNNTTHTITEVQTNFVRVTPGVSSPFGIPTSSVFDWTRPGDVLQITDALLRLTSGDDILTLGADTVLFSGSYTDLSNVPLTFAPSAHTHPFSDITDRPTTPEGYGITSGFSNLEYVSEMDDNTNVGTYVANAIIGGTGLRLTDATGIQVGDFHVFNGTTFTVTGFPGITNVITVSPTPSFSEVGPDLIFQRFEIGIVAVTGNLTVTGDIAGSLTLSNITDSGALAGLDDLTEAQINTIQSGTTTTDLGIRDDSANDGRYERTLSYVSQPETTTTLVVTAGQLLFGSREDIADNLYRVLSDASITDRSGLGGANFMLIREAKANKISNVNAEDTNEPTSFKIWSGTLVEYTALTPSSDTLYNITDD